MAVRVDLFAAPATLPLDQRDGALDAATGGSANGSVHHLGFVSANDADEQTMFDVLSLIGDHCGVFAATMQGIGVVPAGDVVGVRRLVDEMTDRDLDHSRVDRNGPARVWIETIISAMAGAIARGESLVWRTRYDVGGSIDDGPDEFPTAWAGAGTP
jgi:hypothetical protein